MGIFHLAKSFGLHWEVTGRDKQVWNFLQCTRNENDFALSHALLCCFYVCSVVICREFYFLFFGAHPLFSCCSVLQRLLLMWLQLLSHCEYTSRRHQGCALQLTGKVRGCFSTCCIIEHQVQNVSGQFCWQTVSGCKSQASQSFISSVLSIGCWFPAEQHFRVCSAADQAKIGMVFAKDRYGIMNTIIILWLACSASIIIFILACQCLLGKAACSIVCS